MSFGLTVDEARLRLTIPDEPREPIRLAAIAWFSPVDDLDLSVVRLERQPEGVSGLAVADILPALTRKPGALVAFFGDSNQPVILIGYPGGRDLTFSLGGRLLDYDDRYLQYLSETEQGSGGSPVLNGFWQVIGVNRLRGNMPRLSGLGGLVDTCQAVSILAVRQALRAEFG